MRTLIYSFLFCFSYANASEVNIRFAHFMPQNSWQNETMFNGWKNAVEEQSDGRISVTVYPAQTLGKAPAGYDNTVRGITDIAWTVQGYTAGRFPLSQIIELPGLFDKGVVGSCAFQKLYDSGALDEEYKEVKVLYVHTHGVGQLHTKNQQITKLEDMKGLKIRRPTDVVAGLISEMGAESVGMPAPTIYQNVKRGVIDGYMLPWEAVDSFRTYEVSKQHLEFGFYSLAFVTAMNKRTYERLPADLKQVIDDNSGMKWSITAGQGFDKADVIGLAKVKAKGGVVSQLPLAEKTKLEAMAAKTSRDYISELDNKGLPGTQTLKQIKQYLSECSAEHG